VANLHVAPGDGTVAAPGARRAAGGAARSDGFGGLLEGDRVLVLLLLAAFAWGAVHALSPGHGKAMVAAYLVGTRGTPRDAVALGAIVTVTHTIGVFALGAVTLLLSAFVLPEDLYPWLNLASGLLVLGVGGVLVRARLRARAHHHHHEHHHHDHHHHHEVSRRGLIAMGASAGLIPCPSALVVLLGAISQHEIVLGMGLIVAFSLGLAATLTALGLAVVWTAGFAGRLPRSGRLLAAARTLPLVSALVIVAIGALFTAQAVPAIV
ncbi:MAG TPA: sulfite exporter TauE/SafE family protein, partial [Solirubrobacteraceae bacterium]|nr:sulfite exporter TauE/SafE family protein [Solirubrobacteraceae bacterium]